MGGKTRSKKSPEAVPLMRYAAYEDICIYFMHNFYFYIHKNIHTVYIHTLNVIRIKEYNFCRKLFLFNFKLLIAAYEI